MLSDANTRLTRTFSAIQNDLDAVLPPLRVYAEMYAKHGAAFYTHVRDAVNPDDMIGPEMAAWFIFMNETNFNGLCRVNASGKYNVPCRLVRPATDHLRRTAPASVLRCARRHNDREQRFP